MTDEDERELQAELARLQQEHRDLDAAIDALHQSPNLSMAIQNRASHIFGFICNQS